MWSASPHTMHVDRANLIMWYLSIRRSDLELGHTVITVRISRSFLYYAMNELMHVMQLWFFGYMNGHSSHLPWLNYGCKIEYLQLPPDFEMGSCIIVVSWHTQWELGKAINKQHSIQYHTNISNIIQAKIMSYKHKGT